MSHFPHVLLIINKDVGGAGWGCCTRSQVLIFGVRVAGRVYWKVLQQSFESQLGFLINDGVRNVRNRVIQGLPKAIKIPIHP